MLDKCVTVFYKVNDKTFGNVIIPRDQYKLFIKNNRYYFNQKGTLVELHHAGDEPAYTDLHSDYYNWFKNGYLHRIDGPAIMELDSVRKNGYYVFGHEIDEKTLMNNQKYFTRLYEYLRDSPEEWAGLKGMFESRKRLMKCIKEDKICTKLGKTGNTYRYYALKDRLSIAGNKDDVSFTITGDNDKNLFVDATHDSVGIGTIAPETYISLRSDEQKSVQTKDDNAEVGWGVPLTMLALFGAFKVAQGKLSKSSNKLRKSSMAKKTEVVSEKWA